MARPEVSDHPPLLGLGLLLLGWAQYALAAYPIARALCRELRELVDREAMTELVEQVEMLSALVDARQGRPAAAIRRLFRAVDQRPRDRPINDRQADLINAADLAVQIGRPDLATPVLDALQAFGKQPDHTLRPWVSERVQGLRHQMQKGNPGSVVPATDAQAAEKLLKLVFTPA
jgi:hypothetical protein